MYSIEECQELVQEELSHINWDKNPPQLYEPIKYILSVGGKRLRPALVLLSCNLFEEKISQALPAALAIEVFHNFTLMHDDIMDNAELRRNMATVHKKWNGNVAILSGDAMLIKAYELVSKTPDSYFKSIFEVFNKTALEVCEGQQLDMEFELRNDVTENEYLEMIELKTAVLIAASLKIGGILGGASKEDADKLYNFGKNIGMAFQLQDDLLDVFSDPKVFGKATGGDIVTNKKTFLLIHAMNLSRGATEAQLRHWISAETFEPEEKIRDVKKIYEDLKVADLTQKRINHYFNMAMECLEEVTVSASKKQELYKVASLLMDRKS